MDPLEFEKFEKEDYVKVTWSFVVNRVRQHTEVVTQTRIFATDERARKRFGRYWKLIKPFSGITRMEILRNLKKLYSSFSYFYIVYNILKDLLIFICQKQILFLFFIKNF